MRIGRILTLLALLLAPALLRAQDGGVEVDYNHPQKYVIAGISVEGNTIFGSQQIINQTGMHKGMSVTVPGDDISNVVRRLYLQRYFEDVAIELDSLNAQRDSAWFVIRIKERPRVSRWTFSGVKTSERKDIEERLNLRRGGEFSEYVEKTSADIIKRYFAEKGFLLCDVKAEVQRDSVIKNAIRVNFAIDKGQKVRIKEINFIGNEHVKEYKLARSMKKTKSNKFYNFFHSKKFNEKEYLNDKRAILSAFNEQGYRDARLVRDSVYFVEPGRLAIDMEFEEGDKYYFRDVTWTGNSVYSTDVLNEVLGIKKGDVYDMVTLDHRLRGGGKQNEMDVRKLYSDNGFLFFDINAVETNIQNDSVDIELRLREGKQATLNNIVINGNDLTSEKVVRRQLFTRPGYLFSQSDFERSIREIASLGQFDPEAIMDPNSGWSILPNALDNTVDIVYNVTEKPSSTLEVSGGWGGRSFVGTVGVAFNNFSTHRMFEKGAWRPVPLGDAQTLSFRFQTNGAYYTSLNASFTEPWLFGKKPTSLNLGVYYTRQTSAYSSMSSLDAAAYNFFSSNRSMEIFGFSASLGSRLKWPDNYFVMYHGFNWQTYKLNDWYGGYFLFNDGMTNNINYTLNIVRNSTDQQIYPRTGSEFSFSLQLTPPFSLLRKFDYDAKGNKVPVNSYKDINYDNWSADKRYRWIEYHKWKFSAATYSRIAGDLVLMTRAQFGYLGYYNRNWGYSPFEGFLVGGDGMMGYMTYGSELVALRGYENNSLTPRLSSPYSSDPVYSGNVYDKFTIELRYPVMLQPQSTIYALAFLEGGNCWADIKDFNPFQIKRSAGVGVRIFLPMVGLIGCDWGYGFDGPAGSRSHFHFVLGQQF
ncbi:Beta-barrel assembly machine subunit BamA [Bacteroidales bacterium WCE2004]|nr:Beta-barrel assembly machine subunit BamA [Bacteroidales bacterium WCE2004]